jgi:hypothetical protein
MGGALGWLLAIGGCTGEPSGQGAACPAAEPLYNASPDSGTLAVEPAQAQAIVGLYFEDAEQVQCSGTLLGHGFGVSAAHCEITQLVQLRVADEPLPVEIEWLDMHPELDVALFRLDRSAAGAVRAIEPIPLFAGVIDDSLVGERLTLAGLGQTENGESGELRFVDEQVTKITDGEIWVNGMGETGACGGDSGGPILARDESGALGVAGVLDRGSANCLGVDVYSRADRLREWVAKTTAKAEPWPDDACGP